MLMEFRLLNELAEWNQVISLLTPDPEVVLAGSQHSRGKDVAKWKHGAVPAGCPLAKQQEKWPKDKKKKKII